MDLHLSLNPIVDKAKQNLNITCCQANSLYVSQNLLYSQFYIGGDKAKDKAKALDKVKAKVKVRVKAQEKGKAEDYLQSIGTSCVVINFTNDFD